MKVGIVDCGLSNLGSISRAIAEIGGTPVITTTPSGLIDANRIILPGVGSFTKGMEKLRALGFSEEITRQASSGIPILGICLGMHFLADLGTEGGESSGLGLIPGKILRLDLCGCGERIPHMGWNNIRATHDNYLFKGIPNDTDFYFVHSYTFCATDQSTVLASVEYGTPIVAAIGLGNVCGTQFHPEKSSKAGLRLLKNFLECAPC